MTQAAMRKTRDALFAPGAKLVLASHNSDKLRELRELVAPFSIAVLSAKDANCIEPEETGSTFAENAIIKAESAASISGLPSLADDSGLAIPVIGGAPGIYSARWMGPNKDMQPALDRIRKELAAVKASENSSAYFFCALCLALPDGTKHIFEGQVDGTLTFPPRGPGGFGYDPIFVPNGFDKTFGEMPASAKHKLSHRARAFQKFLAYIESLRKE